MQEAAFGALNTLQRELIGQHLYSTFSDLNHHCFPPDTTFTISQFRLRAVIERLIAKYSSDYPSERYERLLIEAVQTQESYRVEKCHGDALRMLDGVLVNVTSEAMESGVWILPEVLGRRDIVLVW